MLPDEQAPSLKGTGACTFQQQSSDQMIRIRHKGHPAVVELPVAALAAFPALPDRLASQSRT